MKTHSFGTRSLLELDGVHPVLVSLAHRALRLSLVDFTVHDGRRTRQEQEEYVRTGVSQTMVSRHLLQEDGWGHALDLVPYVNGRLRWEWGPIFELAEAVRAAAHEVDDLAGQVT